MWLLNEELKNNVFMYLYAKYVFVTVVNFKMKLVLNFSGMKYVGITNSEFRQMKKSNLRSFGT